MRKRKSKNVKNLPSQISNQNPPVFDLDYDKLAQAIISAHKQIKEAEEDAVEKKAAEELSTWKNIYGIKDYDVKCNKMLKKIHNLRNDISMFFHFIFFKRKNIQDDLITFGLMKYFTGALFIASKFFLAFLTVVFLISSLGTLQQHQFIVKFQPLFLGFAFLFFLLSRACRIAAYEVEHIKDRGYLLTIFSAITCFFAMLLSLAALLKG